MHAQKGAWFGVQSVFQERDEQSGVEGAVVRVHLGVGLALCLAPSDFLGKKLAGGEIGIAHIK